MAEPASNEVPKKPLPRFTEQMEASDEFRRKNSVPELTEEEAMEIAVAEVKRARQERRDRARNSR